MFAVNSREYVAKGHYRVDVQLAQGGYFPRVDFMSVGTFKRRFGLPHSQDVARNVAEAELLASKLRLWHEGQAETQGVSKLKLFTVDDLKAHFKTQLNPK
ncbi:hypothetical protein [Atopomonas sediminilitoris]|uniref:hypothetical protein n=1 Tax=Atopomonas sediminilitoris TaxID=2919919 RepID=UPI001F4E808F|nr:hypothetical protein [Atopomonas sediminilitoris]MCJ8167870.1 hypothetical protein [Atopomonas sediminilitoris]